MASALVHTSTSQASGSRLHSDLRARYCWNRKIRKDQQKYYRFLCSKWRIVYDEEVVGEVEALGPGRRGWLGLRGWWIGSGNDDLTCNILQLPEGGDLVALHCQTSPNVDRSIKLELITEQPLSDRCCCA